MGSSLGLTGRPRDYSAGMQTIHGNYLRRIVQPGSGRRKHLCCAPMALIPQQSKSGPLNACDIGGAVLRACPNRRRRAGPRASTCCRAERPGAGPLHVGPHVLRLEHPARQGRDVDGGPLLRGLFLLRPAAAVARVHAGRGIFALFVVHAALALRKFPASYRQYRTYREHMKGLKHEDTTLWYWQVVTGFALFFMASVHLYIMLTHPGPHRAVRVGRPGLERPDVAALPVLLFAVEFHGGIGLYRLALKWGWFAGRDDPATAPQAAGLQVGDHGLLPGARPGDAGGLHQDRHRACAELRRALRAHLAAAEGAP
jgi:succinate dehydrogenase hydrophobic anchor subunit